MSPEIASLSAAGIERWSATAGGRLNCCVLGEREAWSLLLEALFGVFEGACVEAEAPLLVVADRLAELLRMCLTALVR